MSSVREVESLWRDIRQAIRSLRRTPWYSITVISVIAAVGVLVPAWRASQVDPISALRVQ